MGQALQVNETQEEAIVEESERERLSQLIGRIFSPERGETTIGALMKDLDHHGIALVLIVFSFPAALPLPAPGYSTLLSIPLLFIGVGLLAGRRSITFSRVHFEKEF